MTHRLDILQPLYIPLFTVFSITLNVVRIQKIYKKYTIQSIYSAIVSLYSKSNQRPCICVACPTQISELSFFLEIQIKVPDSLHVNLCQNTLSDLTHHFRLHFIYYVYVPSINLTQMSSENTLKDMNDSRAKVMYISSNLHISYVLITNCMCSNFSDYFILK